MENKPIHCTLTDKELATKADQLIDELIASGGKSFTMQVPARPNADTDLIFAELNNRFKTLLKELASIKAQTGPCWAKTNDRLPGWNQPVYWRIGEGPQTKGKTPLSEMFKGGYIENWQWLDETNANHYQELKDAYAQATLIANKSAEWEKKVYAAWDEIERLKEKGDKMETAIKAALAIKNLWLYGGNVSEEYRLEAEALGKMEYSLNEAIANWNKPQGLPPTEPLLSEEDMREWEKEQGKPGEGKEVANA